MNGNGRAVSRAASCAEETAERPEEDSSALVKLLGYLIWLGILCALVPVVLHLLVNLAIWSWNFFQ